jgi:hypothetical protein
VSDGESDTASDDVSDDERWREHRSLDTVALDTPTLNAKDSEDLINKTEVHFVSKN